METLLLVLSRIQKPNQNGLRSPDGAKKVMQFIQDGRYVAVVAGGKPTLYGKRA
jgi:precorrin-3B methylase